MHERSGSCGALPAGRRSRVPVRLARAWIGRRWRRLVPLLESSCLPSSQFLRLILPTLKFLWLESAWRRTLKELRRLGNPSAARARGRTIDRVFGREQIA